MLDARLNSNRVEVGVAPQQVIGVAAQRTGGFKPAGAQQSCQPIHQGLVVLQPLREHAVRLLEGGLRGVGPRRPWQVGPSRWRLDVQGADWRSDKLNDPGARHGP